MEVLHTDQAPQAIGPYSQAILADGFLFASGQIPIDPATGSLVEGDITVQTRQVAKNIQRFWLLPGWIFPMWSKPAASWRTWVISRPSTKSMPNGLSPARRDPASRSKPFRKMRR